MGAGDGFVVKMDVAAATAAHGVDSVVESDVVGGKIRALDAELGLVRGDDRAGSGAAWVADVALGAGVTRGTPGVADDDTAVVWAPSRIGRLRR